MIFAFAIFVVVLFADQSPADDFTYFNTTLCKDYIKQESYNRTDERFTSAVAFSPSFKQQIGQKCKPKGRKASLETS